MDHSKALLLVCAAAFVAPPAFALSENPVLAEANRLAAHRSFPEAEKLYLQVIGATPDNSTAHHMFGRVLALQGRYQEALGQYKLGLKGKAKDPELLNDVGVVLSVVGLRDLGARFLHQATTTNARYVSALNNLGVTLDKLGAFQQASETFQKSLEIQPTNIKIRELKTKTDGKLADNKDFDFGKPVSWQDVPDTLPKEELVVTPVAEPDKTATATPVATGPKPPKRKFSEELDDKEWLQEATPLFKELKSQGFTKAVVYGTGQVQVGNKSDSADAMGEVDLSQADHVEISGEVIVDFTGKGELSLGDSKLKSQDPECVFSVNAESKDLTCYAGTFNVSHWNTVEATRASGKVQVEASNCKYVYGQDDSRIDAKECEQVTLVGQAQGTIENCADAVLNDKSRAVVSNCKKLTLMAKSRARATGCGEIEKLDQAKVEEGSE